MSDMPDFKKLGEMTSVREILETAAEFEREAHSFYTDLNPKVSKNVRYIVEDLARGALAYIRMCSDLAKDPALEDVLSAEVHRPQADHRFSECLQAPELGDKPDDQDVLQYALKREQTAMEEYSELVVMTEPGPLQELFIFLSNEATKNKAELEAAYYELIHRPLPRAHPYPAS